MVPAPAEAALPTAEAATERALNVYMMDLLPTVPYYTGSLCAALKDPDKLHVNVGCIKYHLDRDFFERQELRIDPALLDVTSGLKAAPAALRRSLKLAEYLINLTSLLVRLTISRPDIIHVQFLPIVKFGVGIELWFLQIVRRLGIKVVYTVHNVLPQDTGDRHRTRYRQIYHLADRLICHDECARDRLIREFQVNPERISIIAHGPLLNSGPTNSGDGVRKKLGIAADDCLVLWQGILRPYKGVSFLLEAWQRLHAECPRARLAIVGNGEAGIVQDISNEVTGLGIQSSVYLDFRFVSVAELADYYSAADVVVYPYREITTSGALMTGIGYGKAIVATRQPAFRQILHDEENALMVDYGNVEDLADRLRRLIGDPQLRRRLGEQARTSFANGPQWSEIAQQTIVCYRTAMEAARS
jgi:glycosyltransferase involved in cell wall biosynthesis